MRLLPYITKQRACWAQAAITSIVVALAAAVAGRESPP
jgi:hypothetical protein